MTATDILMHAHFDAFNAFCKLNRTQGQIKKFDRAIKALGSLERAAKYIEGRA
jgi:hypothetical protein